jgi:hypothetical protein
MLKRLLLGLLLLAAATFAWDRALGADYREACPFKGKGTDEKGKPLDLNERWTDTWVKMPSGKWQCVASQASSIKM